MIAKATGRPLSELLDLPAEEYRAWERHFSRGLAYEVWTPLLLVQVIEMIAAAFGGTAGLSRTVPWMGEDPGRIPPERAAAERVARALDASRRRRAREALAALRSSGEWPIG